MTANNNLEHKGDFSRHPFAELLVEILQAKFSGSLRIERSSQKAIVYFRYGEVVYAASNSKSLRLFNLLLRKNRIDTKVIAKHPNFANDLEFAAAIVSDGVITKQDLAEFQATQIEEIVIDVLTWPDGEWVFSPLVRVRDEMLFPIDIHKILIDYARCASAQHVYERFKSVEESFSLVTDQEADSVMLQTHEANVLSRFNGHALTIDELRVGNMMPEAGMLQALYVLWLGGLLVRREWNVAFSATKTGEILAARISRVKEASAFDIPDSAKPAKGKGNAPATESSETVKLPEVTLTLEEYLKQIEESKTHYETLGIESNADLTAIKHAYFSLAKQFHPDLFHREKGDIPKRVQSAFTALAAAHETLRSAESREAYDAKMRKEIEAREKRLAAGQTEAPSILDRQAEQGLESFEEGLEMLNEEEYEAAAKYLARAVHFSPQNALFQAYFGKALSMVDDTYKHKAESAFQTAVKIDPKNSKIRMMLVDFLLDQKMFRRAEGELKRFLELVPNDKEGMAKLAKLKQ